VWSFNNKLTDFQSGMFAVLYVIGMATLYVFCRDLLLKLQPWRFTEYACSELESSGYEAS
jgi:hypothetical protein